MAASVYDPEKVELILRRISVGDSQDAVCKDIGIGPTTFREWVLDDVEGLSVKYARAKDLQLQVWADEIKDISDKCRLGVKIVTSEKDGRTTTEGDMVERAKLQIDSRKWLLSKLMPKKYGDKIETQHSGGITVGWADSGQPKAIEPKS